MQYRPSILLTFLICTLLLSCSQDGGDAEGINNYYVANLMDEPARLQLFYSKRAVPYKKLLYKDTFFMIQPGDTVLLGAMSIIPPDEGQTSPMLLDVFDSASVTFDNWPVRTYWVDSDDYTLRRPSWNNLLSVPSYREIKRTKTDNISESDHLYVIRI